MAHVHCPCGNVLSDITDFLPYKARFLADEDTQTPMELLAQELVELIAAHEDGPEAERAFLIQTTVRHEDSSEEAAASLFDLHASTTFDTFADRIYNVLFPYWARYRRTMYECDVCGRLLVQRGERPADGFLSYAPEHDERKVLASRYHHPWRPLRTSES